MTNWSNFGSGEIWISWQNTNHYSLFSSLILHCSYLNAGALFDHARSLYILTTTTTTTTTTFLLLLEDTHTQTRLSLDTCVCVIFTKVKCPESLQMHIIRVHLISWFAFFSRKYYLTLQELLFTVQSMISEFNCSKLIKTYSRQMYIQEVWSQNEMNFYVKTDFCFLLYYVLLC